MKNPNTLNVKNLIALVTLIAALGLLPLGMSSFGILISLIIAIVLNIGKLKFIYADIKYISKYKNFNNKRILT